MLVLAALPPNPPSRCQVKPSRMRHFQSQRRNVAPWHHKLPPPHECARRIQRCSGTLPFTPVEGHGSSSSLCPALVLILATTATGSLGGRHTATPWSASSSPCPLFPPTTAIVRDSIIRNVQVFFNIVTHCFPGANSVATGMRIVGHFEHSSLAYSRLFDIQTQLGQPRKWLLSTRRNSTVYMLQSLSEQRRVIGVYAAEHELPATLTVHQWELMDNVPNILALLRNSQRRSAHQQQELSSQLSLHSNGSWRVKKTQTLVWLTSRGMARRGE